MLERGIRRIRRINTGVSGLSKVNANVLSPVHMANASLTLIHKGNGRMGEWEENRADAKGLAFSTGNLGLNVC